MSLASLTGQPAPNGRRSQFVPVQNIQRRPVQRQSTVAASRSTTWPPEIQLARRSILRSVITS